MLMPNYQPGDRVLTRRRQTLLRVVTGARWLADGFGIATASTTTMAVGAAFRNGTVADVRVDTLLRAAAVNAVLCAACAATTWLLRLGVWRRTFWIR